METIVYTANELVGLRGPQVCQALLDKVERNPDLADIMKGRSNTHANGSGLPHSSTSGSGSNRRNSARRLDSKPQEDPSSTDSEGQIVFQGKKNRASIAVADNSRGRSVVDLVSKEPLAAPTGLDAQRMEGFKSFFQAVVSPSHVRVTAGGRIVLNDRQAKSPTTKHDRGQPADGDHRPAAGPQAQHAPNVAVDMENAALGGQNVAPGGQVPEWNAPPSLPQFGQGVPQYRVPSAVRRDVWGTDGYAPSYMYSAAPPGMVPVMPIPGMRMEGSAWQMPRLPAAAFPIPNMGMQNATSQGPASQKAAPQSSAIQNPVTKTSRDEGQQYAQMTTENGSGTTKPTPAPIKISPPEFFDHRKPFFYNGHIVYPGVSPAPATLQGQMTPMIHSPYYSGFPAGMMAAPGFAQARGPQFGHGPAFSSVTGASGPAAGPAAEDPGRHVSQPLPVASVVPAAPLVGPVTSIKSSQITQNQLLQLRNSLKYFEDQIQYNRHQIDEHATMKSIAELQTTIAKFEKTLEEQIRIEAEHERRLAANAPAGQEAAFQTPSRASDARKFAHEGTTAPEASRVTALAVPGLAHAHSAGLSRHRFEGNRPRSQLTGINSNKSVDPTDVWKRAEAMLEGDRAAREKGSTLPTGAALAPPFQPRGTSSLQTSSQGVGVQQSGTAIAASPYLVGHLPPLITVGGCEEYRYSRELTEDEKRARHLYWGKFPSAGSGLPKYDGKDFYPASPIKATESIREPSKPKGGQDQSLGMPKSENDPFRKSDPFRSSRDTESIRSDKSKHSKAVPIIDPQTLIRENGTKVPASDHASAKKVGAMSEEQSSPTKSTISGPAMNRRIVERSSNKSSELLQTMLKKGTMGGSALPSTVSAATATGFLPPYYGHATASLSPAIVNTLANGPSGALSKTAEDGCLKPAPQQGENCPPREMPAQDPAVIADLHQRMVADIERRRDMGPGWQ